MPSDVRIYVDGEWTSLIGPEGPQGDPGPQGEQGPAGESGVTDHGALTGLGDDDHSQYPLLAGRSGGQTQSGGAGSGENLTLQSTSHATRGKVFLGTSSAYDEVNARLGVGTSSPTQKIHARGSGFTRITAESTDAVNADIEVKNSVRSWLMRVNSAGNLFFLDVNSVTFPVVVNAGAPSNSLVVDASGRIGAGIAAPASAAALEVSSTTRGFLPPRVTKAQRDAIATPPAGLTVYNSTAARHQGHDGTRWRSFTGYTFPVEDFGAVGNGTTDDSAAIQAAIDAAEAIEDGVVVFDARNYAIASTLRVRRAVFLEGQGAGDDPNSAIANAGTTRLVWTGTSGTGPMVQFKADTSGNWLHGGGIVAMVLDGNNLATEGVHLDSCQFTLCGSPGQMLRLSQFQTQAIRLSSENGQRCRFCEIYGHYRAGGSAAAQDSHGLVFDCNTDAQTSHRVWFWWATVADGLACLLDGFVDNIDFYFLGSAKTGTGGQVRSQNSSVTGDPPLTNIFHHVQGATLEFLDDTYGNDVLFHSSEAIAGITVDSTAGVHYRVHDKNHGDMFQTHVHPMDDQRFYPAGSFKPSMGSPTDGVVGPWGAWNLPNGVDSRVGACLGDPRWANGQIVKVRVHFGHTASTSAVQWAAVFSLHTAQLGNVAASPAEHISSVQAATMLDTANRNEYFDYILPSPLSYTRGDVLFAAVERRGATSGGVDTFGSLLRFLGLTIFYVCNGPDSLSGTYDVPLPYHV